MAVAAVGLTLLLLFLWFVAAILFRCRFQYSLRSLFLLVLAGDMPCSWLATEMKRARRQREAVEVIADVLHGYVEYDFRTTIPGEVNPPYPDWLGELLGDDFLTDVTWVYLAGCDLTDGDLRHLQALGRLKQLRLDETAVTDAGLAYLRGLSHLKELDLAGTRITDAGLKNLRHLSQLQSLSLNKTGISDAGLANLGGLSELRTLMLCDTRVTDVRLGSCAASTNLSSCLCSTPVSRTPGW